MTPEARLVNRDKEMVPTLLLRAMGVLVSCALFITGYAALTDRPLEAMPALDGEAGVVRERTIFINADGMTGAARVLDANGVVIADLDPSQGGFVAGVHRALAFERDRRGVGMEAPIRLVLYETGQLSLRDDATGWRAELIGFGAENADTFAKLLN
ncbi:photosynthetic complex assembly protein PuhC [uncultured Jannaschia sp.]|uniref:photosynthetic complex assembly protein PuhC n=1 Tax=uncultured Jannaschia sp. TaxID=293347 RepID=UPI00260F47D4|nr:photosynthetic complex assembly protein PuhC [uncultured Jannaschia sp.]